MAGKVRINEGVGESSGTQILPESSIRLPPEGYEVKLRKNYLIKSKRRKFL